MTAVRRPEWRLKATCPICEQASALVLVSCPDCGHVAAECEGDGNFYPDARDVVRAEAVDPSEAACPACGAPSDEFELATDTQLQAAGFTPDDYE